MVSKRTKTWMEWLLVLFASLALTGAVMAQDDEAEDPCESACIEAEEACVEGCASADDATACEQGCASETDACLEECEGE